MKPLVSTTRRGEWIIVVSVATLLATIFFGQGFLFRYEGKEPYHWEEVLLWNFTSWYFWAALFPLIFKLAQKFRYDSKTWPRSILVHSFVALVIAVLHASTQIVIVHWLPHPERTFNDVVTLIGKLFLWYILFRFIVYHAILAVCYALDYYRSARESELNSIQLEDRIWRAETQALKMQLEPKFLFRILHSLRTLMHTDLRSADRLIARLGDYFRMTLDNAQHREIPLSKELDFVKCTLEIEKLRDKTAPSIHFQIAPGSLDKFVPNRIVQAPIEAMLKRNRNRELSNEQILVEAHLLGNELQIQIKDSLPLVDASELESLRAAIASLENSRERSVHFVVEEQHGALCVSMKMETMNQELQVTYDNLIPRVEKQVIEFQDPPVNPVRRWGIIVGAFSGVAGYFIFSDALAMTLKNEKIPWAMMLFQSTTWFMWALLTPWILSVVKKYPLRKGLLLKNGTFHVLTNFAAYFYTTLGAASLEWLTVMNERSYISHISWAFPMYPIAMDILVYWTIVAIATASRYRRHYEYNQLRASTLNSQLARAQLQALKMQLHPHFLFNTLNSLSELMQEDIKAAEKMLSHLEHFLLLTVNNSEAQEVPFEQELEFLKCYLAIEHVRFQDRLSIHMDIEPQTLPVAVPNLLLQPIVENAIRHGIAPRTSAGKIEIRAKRNNGVLQVKVHDNGPGLTDDQRKTAPMKKGLGLSNTRERLQQLYGKGHRFQLQNAPEGGLLVTVEIPVDNRLAQSAKGA
jgi:LytS/YehU family sensor histidine kinase